jgi:hypothetical protein
MIEFASSERPRRPGAIRRPAGWWHRRAARSTALQPPCGELIRALSDKAHEARTDVFCEGVCARGRRSFPLAPASRVTGGRGDEGGTERRPPRLTA